MIEELKRLGLTEYEAKVYLALIKLKTATGGQLAKESGVPHGKTYESLHALAEKGLLTILPVDPKQFKLLDPKNSIQQLIKKKTNSLSELGNSFLESISKIEEPVKEKTVEKLELYSGTKKQYELGEQLIGRAKKQILIISKGEKIPHSMLRQFKILNKRGIDYRLIVYEISNKEWIKKFKDAGMGVRYFKTGEFTLVVRDKEEVELVVRNPKNIDDRIVLFFKDNAIASAMATYFETIWKKAKKV